MLKPVCVPCKRFFRVTKTGFYFIEGMPKGKTNPAPGTSEPKNWVPYKMWVGDKWTCEGCGTEILSGFGSQPVAFNHEREFESLVNQLGASQLQVNDC